MSFLPLCGSDWPRLDEEVGARELELDALYEPPARGSIGNVVAGQAAFIDPGMELTKEATAAVPNISA